VLSKIYATIYREKVDIWFTHSTRGEEAREDGSWLVWPIRRTDE
jgi:hypothetical protein